ncbi:hypothetical protein Lser_V15G46212 [Lactuca serriola]
MKSLNSHVGSNYLIYITVHFNYLQDQIQWSDDKNLKHIYRRRGGSDDRNLQHNEWLQTVQSEPDVITMSFVPITSLLNGVRGSGFLSHAINLYLRYKPPFEELHQFLDFQLPRQWSLIFNEQHEQQSSTYLQFKISGPKLYIYTNLVDVGKMPITGLRLHLNPDRNNQLEIHLQHLTSPPKFFQLEDSVTRILNSDCDDPKYYERLQGIIYDHICTAPVESEDKFSIVTGAQLQVGNHRFKKVLFLRLRFSKVLGCTANKNPEWDVSPIQKAESSIPFTEKVLPQQFQAIHAPLHEPKLVVHTKKMQKLLHLVDTTEVKRGPQESPGYWVVSGARLVVEKRNNSLLILHQKISLEVKYSLLDC